MNKQQAKGTKGSNTSSTGGSPLEDAIGYFIKEIEQRFVQAGLTYNNDITFSITDGVATIEIPFYFDFLEKGVNGTEKNYGSPYSRKDKMPPLSAVKEWMQQNGVEIDGKEFHIQEEWQKNGIKPKTLIYSDLYEALTQKLTELYIKDIIDNLENI